MAPSTETDRGQRFHDEGESRSPSVLVPCGPAGCVCTSQVGCPDDGTDTTGFSNTEYFIDIKPKEQWRPVFHQNKEELIEAIDRELEKLPGVTLGVLSADLGQYGRGCQRREGRARDQGLWRRPATARIQSRRDYGRDARHQRYRGSRSVPRHRPAQPRVSPSTARKRPAIRSTSPMCRTRCKPRSAATPSLRCCRANSATILWCAITAAVPRPLYERSDRQRIRLVAPSGERVSLAQLCDVKVLDGASVISREGNSRYVALKFSVVGRDLGSTVEEGHSPKGGQTGQTSGRLSHRLGRRV